MFRQLRKMEKRKMYTTSTNNTFFYLIYMFMVGN